MNRFFKSLLISVLAVSYAAAQVDEPIPDLSADPEEFIPAAQLIDKPAEQSPAEELPMGNSWSVNRSFRVIGRYPKLRSEVSSLAGKILKQFRDQLDEKDEKLKIPIDIVLAGDINKKGVGSPYRKTFGTKPSGEYYVELAVDISRLKGPELRRAIMEVISYSYALSSADVVADDATLVPHLWFIDGMIEMMAWKNDASPSKQYLLLQKNPKLFDLDEIFTVTEDKYKNFDLGTQRSYRAASGAFIMALLDQENGASNVESMLNNLAMFQGDTENLLKQHFPDLSKGKNGTRVAWLLQLAAMSVPKLSEVMTMIESEKALEKALQFRYLNEEGLQQSLGIDAFEAILELEEQERRRVILPVSRQLNHLNNRCFPFYKEILAGYGNVLSALSKGEKKGVASIVAGLKNERELQLRAATQARDFMDLYEIQTTQKLKVDLNDTPERGGLGIQKSNLGKYLEVLNDLYKK